MPQDFLIARNPEEGTTLPYLLRIPLGEDGIVLKAKETWPRTGKVYCHRAVGWPLEPEIVEAVPVRSCVRRGASIDLVLDRGRENRSQFVLTRIRGGREAIFWQTSRTAKQARPAVALPTARGSGLSELEIIVDSHERYAWKFEHQQASTTRRALHAGDYGVLAGERLLASVERKSLQDLVATLTSGRMRYVLADLAALPAAAVVVWTAIPRSSSWTGSGPRWSPTPWVNARPASPRCRSCSARRGRWPRSGPIASWPPPWSTTASASMCRARPPGCRLRHHPRPRRCVRGLNSRGMPSPTVGASRARSWRPLPAGTAEQANE